MATGSPGSNERTCEAHDTVMENAFSDFLSHLEVLERVNRLALSAMQDARREIGALHKASVAQQGPTSSRKPSAQPRATAGIGAGDFLAGIALKAPSPGLDLYMQRRSGSGLDPRRLSSSLQALQDCRRDAPRALRRMLRQADRIQQLAAQSCSWSGRADDPGITECDAAAIPGSTGEPMEEENAVEGLLTASHALDLALLVASLADMLAADHEMQIAAWSDVRMDSNPEELAGYCQMCALRPHVVDEAVEQAKARISEVTQHMGKST